MTDGDALGWRAQLTKVREQVTQMEKRREIERKLEQERNEAALTEKLKRDTPEALAQRFHDIQRRFDHDARRFYPPAQLEGVATQISDYLDLLTFYADCAKQFPKVFTPNHKTMLPALIADLKNLRAGLERQIGQWAEVKTALEAVLFRAREASDDAVLVAVAKSFSDRAHKVPLSIPGDYFSRENENFWVVESAGKTIGYVKLRAADQTLTFALAPEEKANFNKYVRGVLYKFCAQGPLATPLSSIRVHITFAKETKFFTDMGFTRGETKGPGEWIYQRDVE